ncbi:MAG: hypothetical protein ACRC20_12540 [Segniliparus sp.]|uniref:hypothetical protein n=1 Tax=Segniliparus sp. TaxID=2804064 RepID=UPI003F385ED4
MARPPRPLRALAALAPGFAVALAGPIIPGLLCLSDSCAAKPAAPAAGAASPVPGVFPQNSGKLRIVPQTSDPLGVVEETPPIIPGGSSAAPLRTSSERISCRAAADGGGPACPAHESERGSSCPAHFTEGSRP